MKRDRIRRLLIGAPLVALLAPGATPSDARADSPRKNEPRRARAAEILIHIDDPARTRDWFGFDRDWLGTHFGIKKKHGIEWHHTLRMRNRKLRMSVNGPIQRGVNRRHVGLSFQIDF